MSDSKDIKNSKDVTIIELDKLEINKKLVFNIEEERSSVVLESMYFDDNIVSKIIVEATNLDSNKRKSTFVTIKLFCGNFMIATIITESNFIIEKEKQTLETRYRIRKACNYDYK